MKRLLPIALAIAAPAHGQPTGGPSSPEQRAALQSYYGCLYQQARDADDGVAEAATLAHKVAPTCRYLLGAAATIFSQGKPPAERDDLYKKFLGLEDKQVTRVVEAMRQDRQAAALSSAPAKSSNPSSTKPTAAKPTAVKSTAVKSAAVKPKPKPKLVAKTGADGKPISEWRRAYIAKHGHEPPASK